MIISYSIIVIIQGRFTKSSKITVSVESFTGGFSHFGGFQLSFNFMYFSWFFAVYQFFMIVCNSWDKSNI